MKKKLKFLLPLLCMATLLFGSLTVSAASKEFVQATVTDELKSKCNELLQYCNDNGIVTTGKQLIYDVKNGSSKLYIIDNIKMVRFTSDVSDFTCDSYKAVCHYNGKICDVVINDDPKDIWSGSYFANFDYDDGNNCIVANKNFFPVPPVVAPAVNLTGMVTENLKVIIPVAVFCLSCMICLYLLARKLRIFL